MAGLRRIGDVPKTLESLPVCQDSWGSASRPRPSSTCWSAKAPKGRQHVQGSPAPAGMLRLGRISVVSKVFALFVFLVKTPRGLLSSSAPAGWSWLRLRTCPSGPLGNPDCYLSPSLRPQISVVLACQRGLPRLVSGGGEKFIIFIWVFLDNMVEMWRYE